MSKQTIEAGEGYRLLRPDERPDARNKDQFYNCNSQWEMTMQYGEYTCNQTKLIYRRPLPIPPPRATVATMAAKLVDEIARRHKKSLREVERVAIDAVRVAVFKRRHAADVREFKTKCMKGKTK